MINERNHSSLPDSKDILDSDSAALIITIAPRKFDHATKSVACPRATGELNKGAITWEKLDRISGSLPNPLSLMFTMGD